MPAPGSRLDWYATSSASSPVVTRRSGATPKCRSSGWPARVLIFRRISHLQELEDSEISVHYHLGKVLSSSASRPGLPVRTSSTHFRSAQAAAESFTVLAGADSSSASCCGLCSSARSDAIVVGHGTTARHPWSFRLPPDPKGARNRRRAPMGRLGRSPRFMNKNDRPCLFAMW